MEIPRQSQAVNLGRLLLVLSLEPLSKRYRGWRYSEVNYFLLDRIYEVVRHELRPVIHMEKSKLTVWFGL